MQEIFVSLTRDKGENAKAIKLCLAYLSREAKDAGFEELAQLIEIAALAAADVTVERVH